VASTDLVDNMREAQAVAGYLSAAGVATTNSFIGDKATNKNELEQTFKGLIGKPMRDTHQALQAFTTSAIGTQANRWSGSNQGGYSNAEVDRLYDQSLVTLDPGARQGLIADVLKIVVDDAIVIHLYYDMAQQTLIFRKGVRGPGPVSPIQLHTAWNIHTWELD
jgi:peptide/nickel transport system substrate-binding protein